MDPNKEINMLSCLCLYLDCFCGPIEKGEYPMDVNNHKIFKLPKPQDLVEHIFSTFHEQIRKISITINKTYLLG